MVVATPPQPNEVELKKKRQTLERAKANHLSKQLQMRLQYAKLKVEHGWQRQNLNEVENLYFHHSIRVGQRPHYAAPTMPHPGPAPDPIVQSPKLSDALPLLSASDSESVSPLEHAPNTDAQPQACPSIPAALASPAAITFDWSDPNILARLAQLQAQAQAQAQTPTPSQPSTTTFSPPTTSTSQPLSDPISAVPAPFPPHGPPPQPTNHPSASTSFSACSQPFAGSSTQSTSTSTPHIPAIGTSQPVTTSSSIPTPQAPIAPTALTYDSFWSTHASSTGPTRALYRTHTGFTASATPAGNVAMLTPGGHAAVMTAEGVYVGGTSRTG